LKCRYPKWPCMSHLDIYSMSHLDICSMHYGRKKGRESNWQFDSRPLKVGNRPDLGACRWNATHHWKAFKESCNFSWDLVPIRSRGEKLWTPKVPGVQTGTISGFHFGSPGKKCHSDTSAAVRCREYYMGEGGGFPESGPWWIKWAQGCPWLVPTPKVCKMNSNQLVGWIWIQDRITK